MELEELVRKNFRTSTKVLRSFVLEGLCRIMNLYGSLSKCRFFSSKVQYPFPGSRDMFTIFETRDYSIVIFITISPNYRVNLQVTSKQLQSN